MTTSVRRALALSFLERYLTVVLALASNMLLARLLTPEEIGVYSVSLAVIGIAQVLREFGIGNYLIQEKELTDDHIRTAFGISLLLGGGLFSVVFVAAPLAAGFYSEPAMTTTLRIAAVNFLVLPFCTVRAALLRRQLHFKALLYVSLIATGLSQVTTIALAWTGFGSNSMALGSVLLNITMAAGTFVAHEDKRLHLPSLRLWRPILNFGGQSAMTNVVTSISMDANDLVVGKILGFSSVAIISRAQGIVSLFHRDIMGAVRNVALPAFASSYRSGQPIEVIAANSIAMVTLAGWLFYGWISIFPLEAVRILFGTQWDESAELLRTLALGGAFGAVNALIPSLLVATNRIHLVTRLELILQPMRVALVACAAFIYRDTNMVAAAIALSSAIAMPCFVWAAAIALRTTAATSAAFLKRMSQSLVVAAAALTPSIILSSWNGIHRTEPIPTAAIAISVACGLALCLYLAEWIGHPVCNEPMFKRIRKYLAPWNKWT